MEYTNKVWGESLIQYQNVRFVTSKLTLITPLFIMYYMYYKCRNTTIINYCASIDFLYLTYIDIPL